MTTQELLILLQVNRTIAAVRERKELAAVLFEQIRLHIPVDDIGILVPDKTATYWQDWCKVENGPETEAATGWQQPSPGGVQPVDFPLTEVLSHAGMMTVADFLTRYPNHSFGQALQEAGLREMIFTPLVTGNQKTGVLFLSAQQEGSYAEQHLPLIQAIAEQVAVAVATILANEEILEREKEKDLLLGISESIATVRDKQDLFRVIKETAQQALPVSPEFFHIYLWHPERSEVEFYLQLTTPAYAADPVDQRVLARRFFPVTPGDPVDRVLQAPGALSMRTAAYSQTHPDWWAAEPILHFGLDELIGAPLRVSGQLLGYVNVFAPRQAPFPPSHLPLFQAMADQLAVALANILANEEILQQKQDIEERERGKATLLSISGAISSARNAVELLTVIREKAQELIPFYDTGILIVESDGQYHYDLAVNLQGWDQSKTNQQLYAQGLHRVPHPGSAIERSINEVEAAQSPIIQDYEQLFEQNNHPFFPILKEAGYKEGLATLLRSGGKVLGMFWLNSLTKDHFHPKQFEIFQAIADQVSVAVANILANEEILQQKQDIEEREREKALQVSIHQVLSEEKTWERKWFKVTMHLQLLIPFDYIIIGAVSAKGEKAYSFERIGKDEYRTILPETFLSLNQLNWDQYHKWRDEIPYNGPAIYNGEDFEKLCQHYRLKALIAKTFKVQSSLVYPLRLSEHTLLILSMFSRQESAFLPKHASLLDRIAHTLALSVERLLVYEEVAQLNEKLQLEKGYLMEEVKTNYNFEEIIGTSPALQKVLQSIRKVAPTETTVLIEGETGTGKELVARAIHYHSPRKEHPLIKVNCAALPPQLIESELFGHERGAFTGATERRIGKFELAHQGTLFLDEIGELSLELQPKLLRALQEREIERLGGKAPVACDVRIVAATNRNLPVEVAQGRFRADLYYRLGVFPIAMPALRERTADIPLLATYFAAKFCKKMGKAYQGISEESMTNMLAYPWPGNIRELQNVLEQAVVVSEGKYLNCTSYFLNRPAPATKHHSPATVILPNTDRKTLAELDEWKEELERKYILQVLEQAGGRVRGIGGAADLLDVHPNTLESRMKKLNLTRKHVVKE